jgi:hypothetical protein
MSEEEGDISWWLWPEDPRVSENTQHLQTDYNSQEIMELQDDELLL